jgi:hypothetical protein
MKTKWRVRKIFWHKFQVVTVPNIKTIHTIVNKLRQTRLRLGKKSN